MAKARPEPEMDEDDDDLFADLPDDGDDDDLDEADDLGDEEPADDLGDEEMPAEEELPEGDDLGDEELPGDEGDDLGDEELPGDEGDEGLGDEDLDLDLSDMDDEPLDDLGDDAAEGLPEAPGEAGALQDMLQELSGLLEAKLDIVIDTSRARDAADFVSHMLTGVKTHVKTRGDDEGEYAGDGDGPVEEQPQMISMSHQTKSNGRARAAEPAMTTKKNARDAAVEARLAATNDRLVGMMTRDLEREMKGLVRAGKASPDHARQWLSLLRQPPVRMSMVDSKPNSTLAAVLAQVRFAQSLPKGTFWTKDQKVQMSRSREEPSPKFADQPTEAETQDTVALMARMAGVPAQLPGK